MIDGAHAAGQIALDLGSIDADVYFGVAHKWMCAPKGVGFVSVRTSLHDMVRGVVTSWGEHAAADDSAELQALTGTSNLERRFQWQGTRDIAAFLAVPAAIDFQRVHHWADWQRSCHDLAVDVAKRILGRNGLTALAPEHCVAQMVSVPVATRDSPALAKWLREESGIETLATEHSGQALLRISVQAYNGERDLQRLDRAMALAGV